MRFLEPDAHFHHTGIGEHGHGQLSGKGLDQFEMGRPAQPAGLGGNPVVIERLAHLVPGGRERRIKHEFHVEQQRLGRQLLMGIDPDPRKDRQPADKYRPASAIGRSKARLWGRGRHGWS